jgi:23S rRNA pseudouridine1911/1915/1917 synthase
MEFILEFFRIMTKFKVLYEDNHLLAVEKPVNMPVQKDISNDDDLLSLLKQYIKDKYNKPGNVFLGLVHRLDRPVGGAMVFARTSKAASRLSAIKKANKGNAIRPIILNTIILGKNIIPAWSITMVIIAISFI